MKFVKNAIFLVKDLQKLLGSGKFHITSWVSNSRQVMNSTPVSEKVKEVKDLGLNCDDLPIERALGVQ